MKSPRFRDFLKLFTVITIGILSVILVNPTFAQTSSQLNISDLDVSKFPEISAYFRAFDSSGNFVKNIQISELKTVENNTVIVADSVEMLEPGVRFVVAVNEGPTLANRYADVSRFNKVKTAILDWVKAQPATSMNDFSLVGNSAVLAAHLEKPDDWAEVLKGYSPDLRNLKPSLASFSRAVDMAISAEGDANKTPAILYFTPLPSSDQVAGLTDIVNRAKQANVRLFIWLAGPQTYATDETALLLEQFADQSNGAFFILSGAETLPNLSTYLDPLNFICQLKYTSKINASGSYNLSLQVKRNELVIESAPTSFNLVVLPPQPIFLSPPASVTREWTETKRKRDAVLTVDSVELQILIEYPDKNVRELEFSRLFVDGKLAAENTQAPFDKFTWNISGLTETGTHALQVIIQDTVGLQAETIEIPIEVIVPEKPQSALGKFFSNFTLQNTVLIVVIAAVGVLLVLVTIRTAKRRQPNKKVRSHRVVDPVTQPVEIVGDISLPAAKIESSETWPRIPGKGLAPARLVRLTDSGTISTAVREIPISNPETVVGSDRKKADIVFNEPLVAPEHARIIKDDQNKFRVVDSGSSAGTWLNYAPVSTHGARLEHGDLLQFGRASFRFEILGSQPRKIQVLPYVDEN